MKMLSPLTLRDMWFIFRLTTCLTRRLLPHINSLLLSPTEKFGWAKSISCEISLVHRAKLLLYQAHKMIGVFGSDPLPCRSDADLFISAWPSEFIIDMEALRFPVAVSR
jgi:hypothetical protein